MATGTIKLSISGGNKIKFITNPARYDRATGSLKFATDQTESILWEGMMPVNYDGGNMVAQEIASMTSVTSGTVVVEYEIMALSTGESNPEVASFDSVNSQSYTVPDATIKEEIKSITISNLDGLVARDHLFVRRNRNVSPPDDASGDEKLRTASLEYTQA